MRFNGSMRLMRLDCRSPQYIDRLVTGAASHLDIQQGHCRWFSTHAPDVQRCVRVPEITPRVSEKSKMGDRREAQSVFERGHWSATRQRVHPVPISCTLRRPALDAAQYGGMRASPSCRNRASSVFRVPVDGGDEPRLRSSLTRPYWPRP